MGIRSLATTNTCVLSSTGGINCTCRRPRNRRHYDCLKTISLTSRHQFRALLCTTGISIFDTRQSTRNERTEMKNTAGSFTGRASRGVGPPSSSAIGAMREGGAGSTLRYCTKIKPMMILVRCCLSRLQLQTREKIRLRLWGL